MDKEANCCVPSDNGTMCKMEAIITIDERGQLVLPKDLRERAHIRARGKLAVVRCRRDDMIACISLVKATELSNGVKGVLGEMFGQLPDTKYDRG